MIGQGNTQHDGFESENLETNEIGIGATEASTSAVSSLFSEGAFADPNKRRYVILGGGALVALLIAVGAYFFLGDSGSDVETLTGVESGEQGAPEMLEPTEQLPADGEVLPSEEAMLEETAALDEAMQVGEQNMAEGIAGEEGFAMGGVSLVLPVDGQSRSYDETMGMALFQWDGEAEYIAFARNSSFVNALRLRVAGINSYGFGNPYPGRWYWRMEDAGKNPLSDAHSFYVAEAVRRNLVLSEPASGGSLSSGSAVVWSGDEKISFYRVEIASGSFANPNYRFSTVGTSLQLNNVDTGAYRLRVGAFSEVSGRWEYTEPIPVNIQ